MYVITCKPIISLDIEIILLKVTCTRSRLLHITFGCVYRPPNLSPGFWSLLTDCPDDTTNHNVFDLIILGDLNVNVMSPTPVPQFSRFSRFLSDMQLMNIINEPTRPLSNSCLDLVLVPFTMASGVHIDNTTVSSLDGTTDHHLITSNIVLPGNSCSQYSLDMRKVRYPAPHQANAEQIANDITSAFRNPQHMTIDDAATFWQRSLKIVLDTHRPEKLLPIPTWPPPWQTPALHQLFIKRKTAHSTIVKSYMHNCARKFQGTKKTEQDLKQ